MKIPTNIHVDGYSDFSDNAAAAWDLDGARYHVWFNLKTKEIASAHGRANPTLYKNPPQGVESKDPGYFRTVYLDATAQVHAPIVKHVFEAIEDGALIAVAIAAEKEKERQRQAENNARIRQEKIEEAGPRLLEALRDLKAWADRMEGRDHPARVGAAALLRELGEAS